MTSHLRAARTLRSDELAALAQQFAEHVRAGCYQVEADESKRWHVRLHQDDAVEVWLISWTRSQRTELHDHGNSTGAFTVVEGALTEAVWNGSSLEERTLQARNTSEFGTSYIHDVYNDADEIAVSVHAYSPPLSHMNYYAESDQGLVKLATAWTDDPEAPAPDYSSVDDLLSAARSGLSRLAPLEAAAAVAEGALIVDIRPEWQRRIEGEIPGSVIVERNHLEWRLHPTSQARIAQAAPGQKWVVTCSEGYTSSLAAAALNSLGVPATDIVGGFAAWSKAGLPVTTGPSALAPVAPRSA